MSIFKKKPTEFTSNSDNANFEVTAGMHQAMCTALCYKPNVEVEYKGEKKIQDQLQMSFVVSDGGVSKQILSRSFNFVFNEKSRLQELVGTWGVKFDTIGDLLGKRCSVIVVKKDKYSNIHSILPAQGDATFELSNHFIPKFWLVDANNVETNYEVATVEGVTKRPETEGDN